MQDIRNLLSRPTQIHHTTLEENNKSIQVHSCKLSPFRVLSSSIFAQALVKLSLRDHCMILVMSLRRGCPTQVYTVSSSTTSKAMAQDCRILITQNIRERLVECGVHRVLQGGKKKENRDLPNLNFEGMLIVDNPLTHSMKKISSIKFY